MTDCRYCGTSGAYDSGFTVECLNRSCAKYCASWAIQQGEGKVIVARRQPTALSNLNTYDALVPYSQWVLSIVALNGDTEIIKRFSEKLKVGVTKYTCKKDDAKVYKPSIDEISYGLDLELIPYGATTVTAIVNENRGEGTPLLKGYVLLSDILANTQLVLWNTPEQFDRYQNKSPVFQSMTTSGRLSAYSPNYSNKPKP